MEIKIATFQKGTPAQEFLPLITDAHNLNAEGLLRSLTRSTYITERK